MRVAVVLVERGAVALIERLRAGKRYYVFPGGGVETGETPEAAAIREAREELGLDVEILALVARGVFGGNEQHYYLARAMSGAFGSGDGEELTGDEIGDHGSYRAVRWPLTELDAIDVRPRDLAVIAAASAIRGWPAAVVELAG